MKHKSPPLGANHLQTIIYCRVSSKKQEREGDGLASQETRLRDFCQRSGYGVVNVFRDQLTGSESRRPGLREMLAFVEADKKNRYRIVFDHLDRFTRDFYLHADLRRTASTACAWRTAPILARTFRCVASWCAMTAPVR